MSFYSLTPSVQKGYLSDLRKVVRNLLEDMHYVIVENHVSFVTDEFIQHVIKYLERSRFYFKWINVTLVADEMRVLLMSIEQSMRKRTPTFRHQHYFNVLLSDLNLKEDIPKDFLCMKKRIFQLENQKKQLDDNSLGKSKKSSSSNMRNTKGLCKINNSTCSRMKKNFKKIEQSITIQKLNSLHRVWKNTFGEELHVKNDITQIEIDALFIKVNQKRLSISKELRNTLPK